MFDKTDLPLIREIRRHAADRIASGRTGGDGLQAWGRVVRAATYFIDATEMGEISEAIAADGDLVNALEPFGGTLEARAQLAIRPGAVA